MIFNCTIRIVFFSHLFDQKRSGRLPNQILRTQDINKNIGHCIMLLKGCYQLHNKIKLVIIKMLTSSSVMKGPIMLFKIFQIMHIYCKWEINFTNSLSRTIFQLVFVVQFSTFHTFHRSYKVKYCSHQKMQSCKMNLNAQLLAFHIPKFLG